MRTLEIPFTFDIWAKIPLSLRKNYPKSLKSKKKKGPISEKKKNFFWIYQKALDVDNIFKAFWLKIGYM